MITSTQSSAKSSCLPRERKNRLQQNIVLAQIPFKLIEYFNLIDYFLKRDHRARSPSNFPSFNDSSSSIEDIYYVLPANPSLEESNIQEFQSFIQNLHQRVEKYESVGVSPIKQKKIKLQLKLEDGKIFDELDAEILRQNEAEEEESIICVKQSNIIFEEIQPRQKSRSNRSNEQQSSREISNSVQHQAKQSDKNTLQEEHQRKEPQLLVFPNQKQLERRHCKLLKELKKPYNFDLQPKKSKKYQMNYTYSGTVIQEIILAENKSFQQESEQASNEYFKENQEAVREPSSRILAEIQNIVVSNEESSTHEETKQQSHIDTIIAKYIPKAKQKKSQKIQPEVEGYQKDPLFIQPNEQAQATFKKVDQKQRKKKQKRKQRVNQPQKQQERLQQISVEVPSMMNTTQGRRYPTRNSKDKMTIRELDFYPCNKWANNKIRQKMQRSLKYQKPQFDGFFDVLKNFQLSPNEGEIIINKNFLQLGREGGAMFDLYINPKYQLGPIQIKKDYCIVLIQSYNYYRVSNQPVIFR